MSLYRTRRVFFLAFVLLVACAREEGELLSEGERLADHANCGGGAALRVVSGFDEDGDGRLSPAEVLATSVVCESAAACETVQSAEGTTVLCPNHPPVLIPKPPLPAATLVSVHHAEIPHECLRGGFVVASGLDAGPGPGEAGNGVLDASEIEERQVLCAAYCGDGQVDPLLGEGCDDGDRVDHDGCSADCLVEPSCASPTPHPSCIESQYFVDTLSPASGPTRGGFVVMLSGFFPPPGAEPDSIEIVNGPTLELTHLSASALSFVMPAGTGRRSLRVRVNGYPVAFLEKSVSESGLLSITPRDTLPFVYAPPSVTAVEGCAESGCGLQGGELLRVRGQNFGAAPALVSVSVGESGCPLVALVSEEELECRLPARPQGGFDLPVQVRVDGQDSAPRRLLSYAAPGILPGTLRRAGEATGNELLHLSSLGRVAVEFDTVGLTELGEVSFGTGGVRFPCELDPAASLPNVPNRVRCTTAAGALGRDLHFTVTDGSGVESRPGSDRLSFPAPVLVAASLRPEDCEPGVLVPDGAPFDDSGAEHCRSDGSGPPCHVCQPGDSRLQGAHSAGSVVFFDAMNLPNDPSHVEVLAGPQGSDPVRCTKVELRGEGDRVTVGCTMPLGSGAGHAFVVRALNQDSVPGSDVFDYPPAPALERVSGCVDGERDTRECPTAGGTRLRLEGQGFDLPGLWVSVNGRLCESTRVLDATGAECTLPEGVGLAEISVGGLHAPGPAAAVVGGAGTVRSSPKGLLSYAPPRLRSLSGCRDLGASTWDCPAAGGIPLTLEGENFGASGALVFVGEKLCTDLVHLVPHESLRCTLPPGTGMNRAVRVVNGHSSAEDFFVSYRE